MQIAVISDIHSNVFALKAVLEDIKKKGAVEVWLAGDAFGYFPWAVDTYHLLKKNFKVSAVLGNHDALVCGRDLSGHPLICQDVAKLNARDLACENLGALEWLGSLTSIKKLKLNKWNVSIVHGTPDDPLNGRYYPDDKNKYNWLPGKGEILILGHTHYPLCRGEVSEGLLLNPGSVGQPRDNNSMPSWALLDMDRGTAVLHRTVYDNKSTMQLLENMGWSSYLIETLNKSN